MTWDLARRKFRFAAVLACSVAAIYVLAYSVLRCTGGLTHYHYGLVADPAASRERHVVYHEIRRASFGRHHPTSGWPRDLRWYEGLVLPLARLELALRGLPVAVASPE